MVCFFFVLDLFLDLFEFKKFRFYLLVIIEEMSTFLGMLLNKIKKKKISHLMMEKFATLYPFSHDRINTTSIWVLFSNKVLNI